MNGGETMGVTFSTREFARLVNRQESTLYEWKRTGKLVPNKDFSGRYVYTDLDYEKVMRKPYVQQNQNAKG